MSFLPPLNLKQWIEEHRDLLKPPVGNQTIYEDSEFIIMVVGGPNLREDFHVNQTEEFFYQVEGDITVKIRYPDGRFEDVQIKEGEIFLLPAKAPHSPQRPANTVGLVIERKRQVGEIDAFQWYCRECKHKLHEESLFLTDIVNQLPPVFNRFYEDSSLTTCSNCGFAAQRIINT